ncbi:hypothetical protein DFH28DRAFT_1102911 [Melampsora americana]|nr:hypothetical protein DFH28DRAFT_1102911 [Melampsora americana]
MSLYTSASPQAIAALIKSGTVNKDWAVVDVRDDDFLGGHIPGCHHVASIVFREECRSLIERLKDVPHVFFHCALSQQRGPSAANTYAVMREECLEKASANLHIIIRYLPKNFEYGLIKSSLPFGPEARCRDEAQRIVVLRGGFTEWAKQYRDDPELLDSIVHLIWRDRCSQVMTVFVCQLVYTLFDYLKEVDLDSKTARSLSTYKELASFSESHQLVSKPLPVFRCTLTSKDDRTFVNYLHDNKFHTAWTKFPAPFLEVCRHGWISFLTSIVVGEVFIATGNFKAGFYG